MNEKPCSDLAIQLFIERNHRRDSPFETPFPIQLGSLFVSYLEESSRASFDDFLLELKQNGFAVASDISFVLGRERLSFSLNGFVDDNQMHLILTQNMDSFVPVLTEIIRINNKQLNEMRMLRKEKRYQRWHI
ncbi:MAG: hypothetical protein MZU97_05260 [Bacillus subtilis]|nr:hypothetical protein [Bacillus subtilis]